jgi:hypothetical protein
MQRAGIGTDEYNCGPNNFGQDFQAGSAGQIQDMLRPLSDTVVFVLILESSCKNNLNIILPNDEMD